MIQRLQLAIVFVLLLPGVLAGAEEKRLGIYAPQATFTVSITDRSGREYVGLTDLLDPFGKTSLVESGKRWRLKIELPSGSTVQGEFTAGSQEAKLRGRKFKLTAPFWGENQHGFIPLDSAHTVLSQVLGQNTSTRPNSHRIFIGDVATTFFAELQKNNPSKLVLRFSAPVNPTIATEPGRVRMTFSREPLVPSAVNPQTFDDPTIQSATFAENNGSAELVIATNAPLLTRFGENGKTITLTPASTPTAQAAPSATQTTIPGTAPPGTETALATTAQAQPPRPLVILDPSHGGSDPGAALGGGLFEKDVTLAVARRIRNELAQRGIAAVLLRDGDATLTLEQRAVAANSSQAVVYVAIHAATFGTGVRLYSARMSAAAAKRHSFLPWETAQSAYLEESRRLANSIAMEMQSRKVNSAPLEAALRPLRNLAKPAIAIEIAPPGGTLEGLTSPIYQQTVASAVASGIFNLRSSQEALR